MTVQMATRLTLRTFKHKKRKVTIIMYMTSMEYKLSQRYVTLWVLSVHITSYALFNQNWCIFHNFNFGIWNTVLGSNLGPVCDIQPLTRYAQKLKIEGSLHDNFLVTTHTSLTVYSYGKITKICFLTPKNLIMMGIKCGPLYLGTIHFS